MRWIRFTAGGRTAYGIVEGNEIVEVTGIPSPVNASKSPESGGNTGL